MSVRKNHTVFAESSHHPAPDAGSGGAAGELFTHGLLAHLADDDVPARERRVRRVLDEIAAGETTARTYRFPGPAVRRWSAVAAVLALAATGIFYARSVEASAQAVVKASIAALRSSGDRRYEVRVMRDSDTSLPAEPTAVVDTSEGGLMLLRGTFPDGRHEVVVGRDTEGKWAIRRDGVIEREHPEIAWPRWATVGDESLFADSVDRLLEVMTKGYALERRGTEELEGRAGRRFEHLVGEKKVRFLPGANRIELWIDPATKLVERLEMRWDQRDLPPRDRPPRDRQGPAPGPDDADRPARPGPDGPPDGPPLGPPRRPIGPPLGPAPHQPPPGERPARPDVPPGPEGIMRPGGPQMGPGPRPSPPRLLVLERVDAPDFEIGWFSPKRHVGR